MMRAEILDCLTDRPCNYCRFHESGRCERWNCVFEEKPDDAEDCEDTINRQAVLATLDDTDKFMDEDRTVENYKALLKECYEVLPSVTPKQKKGHWIPIKTRPLSDKEKEEYADLGYSEDSISFMYDCPLPDDGQEVLVTTRYDEVKTDTFYRDEGCYFETYCDEDDVKAWMPLPEPYGAESEGRNETDRREKR